MPTITGWKPSAAALAALLVAAQGAHGAHPFITEDTGTQGKGGWQLEINGEGNRDVVEGETSKGSQFAAVLSYGLLDNLDLQLGSPYQDNGINQGAGDAAIDLKWRFYESGPLSLGLKPGVTLPTGKDEQGLGSGRTTWGTLAILSYETEAWAFHSHVGYRQNRNKQEQRESLRHWSALFVYKPTQALRLGIDLAFDTNPDPESDQTLRQLVLGAIYSVTKDFDLDVGVRWGNDPAIDRALMAGITVRW